MWPGRSQERPPAGEGVLDAAFFTFSAVAATWLGYLLLRDGVRPGWPSLLLVVFWVFFTYLLLPRLHRVLTRLYVPDYFLGRARTSDGLLGDPVNIALLGDEGQVRAALEAAGWVAADDISVRTSVRLIGATLRRRSYPAAPVSPLILFDRQQDFAYQQEIDGSPSKRHHVRFWRCPEGWMLPGGHQADWLAAASYDRSVGVSLFTLQVTHRIDEHTDVERDFVVRTVHEAAQQSSVELVRHFSSGYHARNGGGDLIVTDGDLPIVDLRPTPSRGVGPRATDSRDRRPAQTVFGAAVSIARAVTYLVGAVGLLLDPDFFADNARRMGLMLPRHEIQDLAVPVAVLLLIAAAVDLVLARAVLRGRNWARLVLMSVSVVTSIVAFLGQVRGNDPVALRDLPTLAASILVLLALSSHRAREFATRSRGSPHDE